MAVILVIATLLSSLVALLDYLTGLEVNFATFYLLPVFLVAWTVGKYSAAAVAVGAALLKAAIEALSGWVYANPLAGYWNISTRVGLYFIVICLLRALKEALQREKILARRDFLTGVSNLQGLAEWASLELARCRRYGHPLTVAYIDCDNFKMLNDRLGHQEGNAVLRAAAQALAQQVRAIDCVARIGGDAFVLLLPECGSEAAREALPRIAHYLAEVVEQRRWSVTFSIGVVTYITPPDSVDQLLAEADAAMYGVKNSGKNQDPLSSGGEGPGCTAGRG